jgi:redox-sensing transcriptional repressor
MRYHRFLSESTAGKSVHTITSAEIAAALDIDATQVRKDFAAVGVRGIGRVGFDVRQVCRAIRITLGFDRIYEAVLVGSGHLGSALLAYPGFAKYGLHVVAAFDDDERRIGRKIAGCTVKHVRMVESFVKRRKIHLAVLTTPADVSQELTDRLVAAGVKAIWNFTPAHLVAPPDVLVRSEHISRGLSEVAYHLKHGDSLHGHRAARARAITRNWVI